MINKSKVDPALEKMLNELYNMKLNTGMKFLSMANHLGYNNLHGMSKYFMDKYEEEFEDAYAIREHMIKKGVHPAIQALPAPKAQYQSATIMLQESLNAEEHISKKIEDIIKYCETTKGYGFRPFLMDMMDTQKEEEVELAEIHHVISSQIGENNIHILDKEMRNKYDIGYPAYSEDRKMRKKTMTPYAEKKHKARTKEYHDEMKKPY